MLHGGQLTADDIVGCVELGLGRLSKDGALDGWQPVVRPKSLSIGERLWQLVTGPPKQAELRLRASAMPLQGDEDTGPEENLLNGVLTDKGGQALAKRPYAPEMDVRNGAHEASGIYSALAFPTPPPSVDAKDEGVAETALPSWISLMHGSPAPNDVKPGPSHTQPADAHLPGLADHYPKSEAAPDSGRRPPRSERSLLTQIIEPLDCLHGPAAQRGSLDG